MPRPEPPLRWRALRLPKSGLSADECDDAWAVNPGAGRFALADGATESAFAGLWARLLAEGFVGAAGPQLPADWLDGLRRDWAAQVMGPEDMGEEVPWYIFNKRVEGAFATLLGVGLRSPKRARAGRWRAVAVGDTCLARVRNDGTVRAFPVKTSAAFDNQPPLIGSRAGPSPPPEHASGSLLPGDQLFLMTDALAQWFLRTHERGGRPWEIVAPVLWAERPKAAFATWVDELRAAGELRDDDVTLLSLQAAPTPEE